MLSRYKIISQNCQFLYVMAVSNNSLNYLWHLCSFSCTPDIIYISFCFSASAFLPWVEVLAQTKSLPTPWESDCKDSVITVLGKFEGLKLNPIKFCHLREELTHRKEFHCWERDWGGRGGENGREGGITDYAEFAKPGSGLYCVLQSCRSQTLLNWPTTLNLYVYIICLCAWIWINVYSTTFNCKASVKCVHFYFPISKYLGTK